MVLARLLSVPLLLCSIAAPVLASDADLVRLLGPQGVNLWKLNKQQQQQQHSGSVLQNQDASSDYAYEAQSKYAEEFPAQWFEQPLDHFSDASNHTFQQRYWVNKRHYKPGVGGPVYVLDGGETSGEDRLPFLDTGIMDILTRATGGVGIVLEHRYYGESIAVKNLTTDSLRWLNNAQSAADSANFMAHVQFDGIDEDLTAPNTPWIYYGGSYAGARAAHMKILYPELVYGAIASSAVTHAALSNWEYMDVIRKAAPEKCSEHLVNSIRSIDSILTAPEHKFLVGSLKSLFGLGGIVHNEDFVSVLETPLSSWQSKCWVPEFDSDSFDKFCEAITKPPFGLQQVEGDVETLMDLPFEHPARMMTFPGGLNLDFSVVNYAHYIKENVVSTCPEGSSVEECFGTYDDDKYSDTDLDQTWRLWLFQVCTEWGYFTTAPPEEFDGPRIISSLLTLEYESKICKQAFPPGPAFRVPMQPNVTVVNELGDFDIAADRLAFIDGEVDPWRPDTPQSTYGVAKPRPDTLLRPVKLIPNGVHHYDEWGYANLEDEPAHIRKIHGEMIVFVMEWLKDWNSTTTSV